MKTKYRILGMVVMIAVVAIVLPRLWEEASGTPDMKLSFDIPKQQTAQSTTIQLPKQPEIPAVNKNDFTVVATDQKSSPDDTSSEPVASKQEQVKAAPKVTVTQAGGNQATTQASKTQAATQTDKAVAATQTGKTALAASTAPPTTHALFVQKVPDAWVIQLGTFSNEKNVKALINKLRKDGLAAYQRDMTVGDRELIQVFVGPEIEKAKLQPLLNELHKKFNLRGIVRRYKV